MNLINGLLKKTFVYSLVFSVLQISLFAQTQNINTRLLPKMLKNEKLFDNITGKSSGYDVQIIYTKIERENKNIEFTDYYYNVNQKKYFYPSKTVFLPAAVLTLEKINKLAEEYDLDKDRFVRIDDAVNQQIIMYQDTSSKSNYASFAHFIKKMLVNGDKNSYNYCYDFLNQRHFNDRIHQLGYNDSWFMHKLDGKAPHTSRQSNIVTFFRTDMKSYFVDIIYLKRHTTTIPFYSVYVKKGEHNPVDYYSSNEKLLLGKGVVENGNIVDSSLNFTHTNKFTIEDIHNFLKSLMFPEIQKNKFFLTDEDYIFLYQQLSANKAQDKANYLLSDKINDSTITIFNNSGKDLGFMIDNVYVIDKKNGVEFFLTVVMNCNKENIFGDEYYEYETTGLTFMKNLSNFIHQYAIEKKKNHVNFDAFLEKLK
jgi:hypothetical protein